MSHDFWLYALLQACETDSLLGELLYFPEVTALGDRERGCLGSLVATAKRLLEDTDALDLHRRHGPDTVSVQSLTLRVQPPRGDALWQQPIDLQLEVAQWRHGDLATVARVPALDLEVVVRKEQELPGLLESQVRQALERQRSVRSLRPLAMLDRWHSLRVVKRRIGLEITSPKQLAQREQEKTTAAGKPVLPEIASRLDHGARLPHAYEIDPQVEKLADILTGPHERSALLVGPSGVGKTALVHELVRQRHRFDFDKRAFWATDGSRIIAGAMGFGVWQERCQRLVAEAGLAILHLGSLIELLETGRGGSNSQGIADFFRPALERGRLLAIAEVTPEELAVLQRERPALVDAFEQLTLREPAQEAGRRILERFAAENNANTEDLHVRQALDEVDRLHRRFATYSAYPGRPLRFLARLLDQTATAEALTRHRVATAFALESGLPRFLLDDAQTLDLAVVQDWFSGRVLGQQEAVTLVVELLATVKARLNRPHRPLGSLLFVGPTGVGKTEMAKALAQFLFGDASRLVRFDMSEYADGAAIVRLIGSRFGSSARGNPSEGLLTARLREQPFCVVLLDEFEKAHPSFYDLLLQVLGEGRLTDAAGRLAEFHNAIIIMTSNLQASEFQQGPFGFAQTNGASEAHDHFIRAAQSFLRPEIFNRIDRIVPFAPLDETTAQAVTRRELELIRKRDGLRLRSVELNISDEATRQLAHLGFNPQYGARPLKRAIERHLLAPLAERLNSHANDLPLTVTVRGEHDQLLVEVASRGADARRDRSQARLADSASQLRRRAQQLDHSAAMRQIRNEATMLERSAERARRQRRRGRSANLNEWSEACQRQLSDLQSVIERVERHAVAVSRLEESVLLDIYGHTATDRTAARAELTRQKAETTEILLDLHARQFSQPGEVTIVLIADDTEWLLELAQAYWEAAHQSAAAALVRSARLLTVAHDARTKRRCWLRWPVEQPAGIRHCAEPVFRLQPQNDHWDWQEYLPTPEETDRSRNPVMALLRLRFPMAYPLFNSESGVHVRRDAKEKQHCLVEVCDLPIDSYVPPDSAGSKEQARSGPTRRVYDMRYNTLREPPANRDVSGDLRHLGEELLSLMERRMLEEAQEVLSQ